MIVEQATRRVLAAVRFTDPMTGRGVLGPLRLDPSDAEWFRNRSGLFVLAWLPGLEDHASAYDTPPAAPPVDSVTVQGVVRDNAQRYLPRAFSFSLPRDPADPDAGTDADLYTPVDVPLQLAPSARLERDWAALWVRVELPITPDRPQPVPAEGALVRLSNADGTAVLALTGARGEALAVMPGIPRFGIGDGLDDPVLVTHVPHTLDVVTDLARTDPVTGRRRDASVPDPEDLWARRAALSTASQPIDLSAGQRGSLTITLP